MYTKFFRKEAAELVLFINSNDLGEKQLLILYSSFIEISV